VQVSQLLINLNNGMCVKCCKKACLIKWHCLQQSIHISHAGDVCGSIK
jgi:hypothetical protein